ncbi:HNH endonuclease family protein [Bacillus safensis]|uniref:HNH endonuclease family protein n=1 Tax=Bacillus TaxID=1386 RepID=UPI002DB76C19|nr:HNH endonuclease family protein [Bacillus safensis]MEC0986300.1 HNH endonuclease family protein [Bacillus safensis]
MDIESYTIEHIMPQNKRLSDEWKQDLGEDWEYIHNNYIHTLGNLTLTRYNSELSDKPFKVKRDMEGGFADSPLRLNRGLGQLEVWNEQEMKN